MDKRESTILIPVPEVEFLVSDLRARYDPSGSKGVPAHVTLLFPFIPPEKITPEDIKILQELFKIPRFEFTLSHINTFPDAVFIEPKERELFVELTRRIYAQFPDYPPEEGKYLPEINPHLTIGHQLGDRFDECLEQAKKIEDKLPIRCNAEEIYLMTSKNGYRTIREKFILL